MDTDFNSNPNKFNKYKSMKHHLSSTFEFIYKAGVEKIELRA
jgi:hypothetical protein